MVHYQLLTWPDHGVFSHFDVLFQLIDTLATAQVMSPQPMGLQVIHCSAGIGRAGTVTTLALITAALTSVLTNMDVAQRAL